jgi:hypothetical protein
MADPELSSKVREIIERHRAAGHLPLTTIVGDEREKQQARQILDSLPPNGEIYWHGADGRPCPCSSCVLAVTRLMDANGLIKMPAKEKPPRER